MNEIDKTAAEILALPDNEIASWYMSTVNCPDDMEAVDLKALATAYTQLKADLATERERREELEVVAAALYLGHDDGQEQFDMYKTVYLDGKE